MNQAPQIIAALRAELNSAAVKDLPAIIGQLEAVKAEAFARLCIPATTPIAAESEDGDRLLTADEVGERLGQTARWVRDHQSELPRVKLPGRALRFSEHRLSTLIKRRSYGA